MKYLLLVSMFVLWSSASLYAASAAIYRAFPELTFAIVNIEDEVIHTLKLKKNQLSFRR